MLDTVVVRAFHTTLDATVQRAPSLDCALFPAKVTAPSNEAVAVFSIIAPPCPVELTDCGSPSNEEAPYEDRLEWRTTTTQMAPPLAAELPENAAVSRVRGAGCMRASGYR